MEEESEEGFDKDNNEIMKQRNEELDINNLPNLLFTKHWECITMNRYMCFDTHLVINTLSEIVVNTQPINFSVRAFKILFRRSNGWNQHCYCTISFLKTTLYLQPITDYAIQ